MRVNHLVMRKLVKIICFAGLTLSLACTKTGEIVDPEMLPTAQIYITGANEILRVPGTNTTGSYSFDKEGMKIYANLGVGRSGVSKREAFSVSLSLNKDTVSRLTQILGEDYLPFPEDLIHIPEKVDIQDGEDGVSFLVELDLARADEYLGKTLVAAIELENPSNYTLSANGSTKIIYFNYLDLLGLPTFVDEFSSRDFTLAYADIVGTASFEKVGDPQNYYNDADRLLRSSDDAVHVVYDVAKMENLLPFASGLSGFKINALAPDLNIFSMMKVTYSTDDGQTFSDVNDIVVDAVNIPELGLNSWVDFYLQAPLPEGTTHLGIELLNQAGTGLPPWNPLLRRVEIFYNGGTPYSYQQPNMHEK